MQTIVGYFVCLNKNALWVNVLVVLLSVFFFFVEGLCSQNISLLCLSSGVGGFAGNKQNDP